MLIEEMINIKVMKVATTLGEKIKELRENLGMTQEELAEGICTRSYISIIEKNQMKPSAELIIKLSKKLGYDLRNLKESAHPASPYYEKLNQIETLLYNQDDREALKQLQEIPEDAVLPPFEKAKWLWEKAVLIALPQERWTEGESWCNEALQLLADSTELSLIAKVHYIIGVIRYRMGKLEDAFESFNTGIQVMTQSPSPSMRYLVLLYLNLAMVHNEWKEPRSALICVQKAKDLNKNTNSYYHVGDIEFHWGLALSRLNDPENAKLHYNLALQFYQYNEKATNLGAVYTNLGIVERQLGNFEESLEFLQKAIQHYQEASLQEKEENSRYELALTLFALNRYEEALETAKALHAGLPQNSPLLPNATWLTGEIYLKMNDLKEANRYLQQAYQLIVKDVHCPVNTKQLILTGLVSLYQKQDTPNLQTNYLEMLHESILGY